MKVTHISPSYAPAYGYGGPVQSLEGLASGLKKLDIEQRVLTTNANGARVLEFSDEWKMWKGVPVKYLRRWFPPDVTLAMLPHAYESALWSDVVHVTGIFCVPSILGMMAAKAAGKPLVLSVRGALQPVAMQTRQERKERWLRCFRDLYAKVDVFHATADIEIESIAKYLSPNARIEVIPNGTWGIKEKELSDIQGGTSRQRLLVGMLGRLHPIKGIDRVIESMAILRGRGVEARLEVVGSIEDIDYVSSLRARAENLGIASHVEFLGPLYGKEKQKFYARCGVFVVASHSENFSNVVVEALDLETPVVASRGSPWGELEKVGCGSWVENDPASLADAIEPYLVRTELAGHAGRLGRQLVQDKYTWPGIAQRMMGVYGSLLLPAGRGSQNTRKDGKQVIRSGRS